MAKWCDEGETAVGEVFLTGAAGVDKYLALFTNSSEPAETASISSLEEVTGSGYARIQLGDADWTEQATKGEFQNTQKTFSATGDWGDVTGYAICTVETGTAGSLLAVETFSDGPYTVNNGWSVKITPTVTIA